VPLVLYYVKLVLLGSTPRAVFGIKYGLQNVAWGTLFPSITLLTVIGMCPHNSGIQHSKLVFSPALGYSIISPIINGFACATFFAFYMLYKYLFLYAYEQPASGDTGGLFFPKAIQHIFVGLYVQQVSLLVVGHLNSGMD
jgi:calcium permeable stress-gated cation channel